MSYSTEDLPIGKMTSISDCFQLREPMNKISLCIFDEGDFGMLP